MGLNPLGVIFGPPTQPKILEKKSGRQNPHPPGQTGSKNSPPAHPANPRIRKSTFTNSEIYIQKNGVVSLLKKRLMERNKVGVKPFGGNFWEKNPAGKTGPAQKIALNPRIRIFPVWSSNSEKIPIFDNFENLVN